MIETVFACSSNQTNSNGTNRSFLLCRRMHTIVQILFTKSLGFPRRLAGLYNRTELVQFFIPPPFHTPVTMRLKKLLKRQLQNFLEPNHRSLGLVVLLGFPCNKIASLLYYIFDFLLEIVHAVWIYWHRSHGPPHGH